MLHYHRSNTQTLTHPDAKYKKKNLCSAWPHGRLHGPDSDNVANSNQEAGASGTAALRDPALMARGILPGEGQRRHPYESQFTPLEGRLLRPSDLTATYPSRSIRMSLFAKIGQIRAAY